MFNHEGTRRVFTKAHKGDYDYFVSLCENPLCDFVVSGNTSFSDFSAPAGYVYYVVEIMLDQSCELHKSLSAIRSNIASNNPNVGIVGAPPACVPLRVYPYPTNGILHVVSADAGASTLALPVQVYNIAGQSVGANLRVCPNDNNTITLDLSHLAKGMYFLKAGGKTVKIIKE